MSNTAQFIRQCTGWLGDARLYKLSEPVTDYLGREYDYVVVSGVDHTWATETFIFPANGEGEVIDMVELDGSFKGAVDHAEALRGAGYEVAS